MEALTETISMSPIAFHELVSLSFALIIVNPHNHLQEEKSKLTPGEFISTMCPRPCFESQLKPDIFRSRIRDLTLLYINK